ncbi:hypothetical protein COU77_01435 [Candidatus Peregrinibacteria bacterium CG10_big_fil_rev_8_21_14_0_10_49_16]|nr:MAG: hypothetical protein COW95_01185 [Candidatus Peregrinibacteria bacterium CG22_combo_CG10-13_8_21_14_all_49_11]PIR52236.1 MAG: hypothetical protein COU77_01435 [Candidatus Peregrinibacteria bacterium CG10_big_fil_rev_8_21_14_0_10_49_16]
MRVTYVTQTRFPVQKAHGKQIAEVCAALAALGHDVRLLCPSIHNAIKEDAFSYYGLARTFTVEYLPHVDATESWWIPGRFHFLVNMYRYRKVLGAYFARHDTDCIYVRSRVLLPVLIRTKRPVVFEAHTLPEALNRRFVKFCNQCRLIVCLTSPMRGVLLSGGVQPEHVMIAHDGVDTGRFQKLPTVLHAREQWRVPLNIPVVGYVGSLVTRGDIAKGVGELLEAFSLLKERNIPFFGWIVGGPGEWVKQYQKYAEKLGIAGSVMFEGHIRAQEVPSSLTACDVLVYPAPKTDHPYFHRDTSPLKLFEYLAAGRPIVCADLPPVRDVVGNDHVFFCKPGDPEALAWSISYVLNHPQEAAKKVRTAKELSYSYSWEKRMKRILDAAHCSSHPE